MEPYQAKMLGFCVTPLSAPSIQTDILAQLEVESKKGILENF